MRSIRHTFFPRLRAMLAVLSITTVAACSSPEERAQSHYESGIEYLEAGDHTRAMLEFRNAVKLDETVAGAWFGIATIEEQSQNWQAVANGLQRVIELDASHVEARTKLARLRLAGGDVDKALELVNAADELKPDDTDIVALRGAVLLRLNDREGAKAEAERALSIDRENPDAYAVLAAESMLDENTAATLRFLDRGLQADPNNIGLLLFKLKIHEGNDDDGSAETVMRQLVIASSESKEMRRALVKFLVSRNRLQDAETELRALVASDPDDTAAALELVGFLNSVNGADAARRELTRLTEARPATVDYSLALARLEFSQSDPEAASDILTGIISKGEPAEDVQRARLALAEIMLQQEKSEDAASLVTEALAADENNADALALRARMRITAGELDSAIADLREALDQQPNSVPLLQLLGAAFERNGAIDLAHEQYVQAVRTSNYAPSVALRYADFLSGRGDSARAEQVLSESLSRNPNNAGVLSQLARIRLSQRDWQGAEAAAELLKKVGDKTGTADQILGASLLGQQKFDRSIETLKDAYASTPEAVRPMYSLVAAYLRADKADEAEAFLASVLAASPDNAEAHVLLGSLRGRDGQLDEALAAYNRAIEAQPGKGIGYVAVARHLLAAGKTDEAEEILLNGRENAPRDLGVNLTLAGLLETKSDVDGALSLYEGLLNERPDSLILINNVASLLSDHRIDEESLDRAYRLALRLSDVDVPQFKDTLGWVRYRRGEYRAALSNLEEAVEGLPEHPMVRYHLGMTYAALERHEDAKEQFAKASELLGDSDPLRAKIADALGGLKSGSVN